jgi:hypothetical protein
LSYNNNLDKIKIANKAWKIKQLLKLIYAPDKKIKHKNSKIIKHENSAITKTER